ncbi:uncharacterized protein LOC107269132 isoform X2 [Cephus cinctus]|uniref:Uncharacterized protein LOC107269132 isoform X2 n=1 Tax=Cephus cinctus TaxID=211228 RepID=A0AAJ7BZB4_CEPCN|nr:uncharacterized protein LOC107269132 isoform X2 [Cephus cinctus]
MSLVAYDSSGDSSDDEHVQENQRVSENLAYSTKRALNLPSPKQEQVARKNDETSVPSAVNNLEKEGKLHFNTLPKPKTFVHETSFEIEDDYIPMKKEIELTCEKPIKKSRAPVKITVPSLSEFKDVDEETEKKQNTIKASEKGTGLFSILPPPKGITGKKSKNFVPYILTQKPVQKSLETQSKHPQKSNLTQDRIQNTDKKTNALGSLSYDSNSDDEDDTGVNSSKDTKKIDFFSLSETNKPIDNMSKNIVSLSDTISTNINTDNKNEQKQVDNDIIVSHDYNLENEDSDKTLVSNVINLPKDEILLKNKAEVGPKLPVPEQEYHVDSEGNVAFDEKAIEYLCGKRGVKRKNKEVDGVNIIEINGEDIKPDEREWLVKALTEEGSQRPVSMQSAGPSTQSKKKHQITYLAHQAKAMEVELKNQWAQNRMTRKQTQSKYGF